MGAMDLPPGTKQPTAKDIEDMRVIEGIGLDDGVDEPSDLPEEDESQLRCLGCDEPFQPDEINLRFCYICWPSTWAMSEITE